MRSLADEVPFDIPDSWEWVRIRSLGEIVRGSGIKRNETVQQGLPCVRYGELYTTYQTSFTSAVSFIAPDLYEKCKHFSYGDVLMTLGKKNIHIYINTTAFFTLFFFFLYIFNQK